MLFELKSRFVKDLWNHIFDESEAGIIGSSKNFYGLKIGNIYD